jgi:hypothetical protein
MSGRFQDRLWRRIVDWLNSCPEEDLPVFCNFDRLKREIRPADVILFEGRSHVSEVIKIVTLSPWTHAAIYIGRLVDIQDSAARRMLEQFHDGDAYEPLIVESLLGKGTIVTPLSHYQKDHLRICRPSGLLLDDTQKVVNFAIEQLGTEYDVRQLLDLARLSFPYAILPRKWRSSLFQHNAGKPTHIVCSSMIARCFQQVSYPILPVIRSSDGLSVEFHKRNFRLFVPSDFDYSPYFKVVKYSFWGFGDEAGYRKIKWIEEKETKKRRKKGNTVVALNGRSLQQLVARRIKWSG